MKSHPIDIHVGRRIRQRRRLLGMTQEKLANAVSIRFQQIQKYESGANRVSASRLWSLARALDVSVSFFFEGLSGGIFDTEAPNLMEYGLQDAPPESVLDEKETIELVRYYYSLNEEPRRRFLDLARALSSSE